MPHKENRFTEVYGPSDDRGFTEVAGPDEARIEFDAARAEERAEAQKPSLAGVGANDSPLRTPQKSTATKKVIIGAGVAVALLELIAAGAVTWNLLRRK